MGFLILLDQLLSHAKMFVEDAVNEIRPVALIFTWACERPIKVKVFRYFLGLGVHIFKISDR